MVTPNTTPWRALSLVLIALGSALAALPPGREGSPPTLSVGPNVLVSSAHSHDTHYEVAAAADPRDPSRLVVGSIVYPQGRATFGTVVYQSTDGGATWKSTLEPEQLDGTGDPAAAFGPDGTAYYVASMIPPVGDRQLLLFRSPTGGSQWEGPFPLTYMDRQYIAVDGRRGRVYVNGNNRVPRAVSDFVLFSSTDGGRSFQGPGTRAAFGSVNAVSMGNAVVATDGSIIGVYAAGGGKASKRARLEAIWSVDGGASLAPSVAIDEYVAGGERKGAILGNANAEPALAIDTSRGSLVDRLYVVWPDRRSGHSHIRFAMSGDKGRTWSASRVIDDIPPGDTTDQFMPEVAVNRSGVVGVSWYDRRNHPDNLGWDVRFTASFDGGVSFVSSVKVSEHGSNFPPGTSRTPQPPVAGASIEVGRGSFRFMGGDTAGLVADANGVFHVVWVDNHTGVPQVFTATVTATR